VDLNAKKKEKKTPKPRKPKTATASTSRAAKAKTRAKASSVKPDSDVEEETQLPIVFNLVDDDACVPSTEIRDPPQREMKRRRTVGDDDELPIFAPEPDLAIAHKQRAALVSSSKKRKTI
jgi:hypothetical protein